jgi:hypothetical protein
LSQALCSLEALLALTPDSLLLANEANADVARAAAKART